MAGTKGKRTRRPKLKSLGASLRRKNAPTLTVMTSEPGVINVYEHARLILPCATDEILPSKASSAGPRNRKRVRGNNSRVRL